jgi:hypothetical protein
VDSPEEGPVELRQAQLDRWASVRVATLLQLPESNVRAFMIAASIGSILDENGTTNRLKSGASSPGVLISKKRAARIRRVLGINPRRWRVLVADWTDRYVAHRCSAGVVVLFTKPFLEECPACGKWIEGRGEGTRPSIEAKPRGRAFERGTDDAAETALIVPPSGADSAVRAAQRVPRLGTNPPHQKTGLLSRDEREVEEVQPSEVPSEVSSEGSQGRRDRDSRAWPEPSGGYLSAWDIDRRGSEQMRAAPCLMCELELVLRGQSGEFRQVLQKMNPVTDPNYEALFHGLVYADQSLGMLKGRARGQRRSQR